MINTFINNRLFIGLVALAAIAAISLITTLSNVLNAILFIEIGVFIAGIYTALLYRRSLPVFLPAVLFVACVAPLTRVSLPGNLPLYYLDGILGVMLLDSVMKKDKANPMWRSAQPLPALLFLIWIPSTILNFLHQLAYTGVVLEPTYSLLRVLLVMSIFYILPSIVKTERYLNVMAISLLVAMIVCGLISFVQYLLPADHPILDLLDSLSPTNLALAQAGYLETTGIVRSRGLIGHPTSLGIILASLTALAMGMYQTEQFRRYRRWIIVAIAIAVLGIVTTNSRSALIALGLVVSIHVLQSSGNRTSTLGLIVTGGLVLVIAIDATGIISLEFITQRFESLGNVEQDYGNQARIDAYNKAFELLLQDEKFFLVGRGDGVSDLLDRQLISPEIVPLQGQNLHSVFTMMLVTRGLITAIIFIMAYLTAIILLFKRPPPEPSGEPNRHIWLIRSMRAMIIAILPWLAFEHSPVTSTGLLAFLFMVFGLTIVAIRFAFDPDSIEPEYRRLTE